MLVIQKPIQNLFDLLREQRILTGERYRPFHFLLRQPVEGGELFFHALTKELVVLTEEEAVRFDADPLAVPELAARWFAVPDAFDDRLLCQQMRTVARMIAPPVKAITGYTILTTTDCNARCFYCYELGHARIPMTVETADRVARFIIEQSKGIKVKISWFGGEPLYNKAVISQITSKLREAGVEYASNMVSNGYLMDEDTVREAKDQWLLEFVQITLDGTEETYNRAKAYIYKEGNPFRRVLDNIHHLLEANIAVNIRINIDTHNVDNLLELVELLHERFGACHKLSIYTHILLPTDLYKKSSLLNDRQRSEIYKKSEQIQQRLEEWGMNTAKPLPNQVKINQCMADSDASVVILSDGHLGKCEHYIDSEWFGHIDSSERDDQMFASFKETEEDIEACETCAVYPDCIRLKKCDFSKYCYPELREERLHQIKSAMLRAYEKYQTDQKAHEPEV